MKLLQKLIKEKEEQEHIQGLISSINLNKPENEYGSCYSC